jgi:hypothetical protein
MSTEVTVTDEERESETRRKLALLRAIGLDRVSEPERELALAIAKRYDLDLLLKHAVLIEGRIYVTRDGLLHVAHRSGQLDGIEVTEPAITTIPGVGDFWRAEASVFRKDMSRPFRYAGRYPVKGSNQRYGPEMAVKVAEVMALRRAFNVSAPVIEERWDLEATRQALASEPEPPRSLQERIEARRQEIAAAPEPAEPTLDDMPEPGVCGNEDVSPMGLGFCDRVAGHRGNHQSEAGTWPA